MRVLTDTADQCVQLEVQGKQKNVNRLRNGIRTMTPDVVTMSFRLMKPCRKLFEKSGTLAGIQKNDDVRIHRVLVKADDQSVNVVRMKWKISSLNEKNIIKALGHIVDRVCQQIDCQFFEKELLMKRSLELNENLFTAESFEKDFLQEPFIKTDLSKYTPKINELNRRGFEYCKRMLKLIQCFHEFPYMKEYLSSHLNSNDCLSRHVKKIERRNMYLSLSRGTEFLRTIGEFSKANGLNVSVISNEGMVISGDVNILLNAFQSFVMDSCKIRTHVYTTDGCQCHFDQRIVLYKQEENAKSGPTLLLLEKHSKSLSDEARSQFDRSITHRNSLVNANDLRNHANLVSTISRKYEFPGG
ncbi:hypothetical protein HELRODRAFT_175656 [Helobdella robusta]|uniref:Uncharacterized protein n=1 Tax=Helobdella robusta TaxID=6412 RepID=T1F9H4_HELRO|nr:hypothetical protein HELRODRAFT_175656 [Helobdella robusta]ESO00673.1 hypothetical protein HELRODRAFT_175656 [Helobdella robusta]